jgi:hypothetical protein
VTTVVFLAIITSGCAVITVRRLYVVPRCADGLPPVILVDQACPPDGICGYSCLPNRWKAAP